jgi:hypothetical protein
VFIELTDHLRCPGDHAEGYLVLLPERFAGRRVVAGVLGCPVCAREVKVADATVDFGDGAPDETPTSLSAAAVHALAGLDGPGGYVALVGAAGRIAAEVEPLFAGIRLVLVNPPAAAVAPQEASVLRAARLPLKRSSMRAVVVGGAAGRDIVGVARAFGAVLPGNRLVVEGPVIELADLEVMAEAGGVWVGRKITRPGAGAPDPV